MINNIPILDVPACDDSDKTQKAPKVVSKLKTTAEGVELFSK